MKKNRLKCKFLMICILSFGIFFKLGNIHYAAAIPKLVFMETSQQELLHKDKIQMACDLLGIETNKSFVDMNNYTDESKKNIYGTGVAIVTIPAIKGMKKEIIRYLKGTEKKLKILIIDADYGSDPVLLEKLSEGSIKGFRYFKIPKSDSLLKIDGSKEISRELANIELPLKGEELSSAVGFELNNTSKVSILIKVMDLNNRADLPIFVKVNTVDAELFFLSSFWNNFDKQAGLNTPSFWSMTPFLMFLKYSLGDWTWHNLNDYANLTIDDPWLREPYGHVNFRNLCSQARSTPFHATIGFIPFNFNRSEDEVVKIFRQCSTHLSISVHGNNHDFREFKSPKNNTGDETSVVQALKRMEEFQYRTGIPYDRVMIFPRGVFTRNSIKALKKNGFLMTVNATILPVDSLKPISYLEELRGISVVLEKIAVVRRLMLPNEKMDKTSNMALKNWVAMRFFLDVPVLLATHHDFFRNGMESFNSIADLVKEIQPEVSWASLQDIGRGLYLQRKINEQKVEVMAFSPRLKLRNTYPFDVKFEVRKMEDPETPIKAVKIEGEETGFKRENDYLYSEFWMKPGQVKNWEIVYNYVAFNSPIREEKVNLEARAIRFLSDFRDNTLSLNPFTEKVVVYFYKIGGIKKATYFLVVLFSFAVIIVMWKKIKCLHKGVKINHPTK